MEVINQLEVVKERVKGMNTQERTALAANSGVPLMSLYRILRAGSKPSYDTVYSVFAALVRNKPARGKK